MCSELDRFLGRRLRQRRRLLRLSQQDVGQMCGVRFQQIQKYECAANRMSATMLWMLARALDVEIGYFFAGFDEDAAQPAQPAGRYALS